MSPLVADTLCLRPRNHTFMSIREWVQALCFGGIILAGLGVLMAIQGPASAQEADEHIERISVPYGLEDLSAPVRTRHLLMRIDRAALKACGDMNGLSIPTQKVIERSDCRRESFARTVKTFHSPMLTHMADTSDPWIGRTVQEP
ncbi:UrcA family protein [Acetobacter tropicalis]|uniref:UrcA family protein n=1 Tax=Acetobacter tropicalis TaxID=104102 RepID=UPI000A381287|nr:UrcA family protein [Acetobacter tropicalis]